MSSERDLTNILLDNRLESDRIKLAQLAVSDDTADIVKDLAEQDIPMQLRAFLLMIARMELVRTVKKSTSLQELETVFFSRALEEADSTDMKSLGEMVKIGSMSVDRSIEFISSLVQGKGSANVFIDKSTKVVNNVANSGIVIDKSGIEKVRNLFSGLAGALEATPQDLVNSAPIPEMEEAELVKKSENKSENDERKNPDV